MSKITGPLATVADLQDSQHPGQIVVLMGFWESGPSAIFGDRMVYDATITYATPDGQTKTHHVEQLQSPPGHADTREAMASLLAFLLADVDQTTFTTDDIVGYDLHFPLDVVRWAHANQYELEHYQCAFDILTDTN